MWFIGVEEEQETSAPPSKKNPGSAPVIVFLFDVFNTMQFDEMMYIVPACAEKTYFGLTAQWQLPPNVFPFI